MEIELANLSQISSHDIVMKDGKLLGDTESSSDEETIQDVSSINPKKIIENHQFLSNEYSLLGITSP